MLARVRAAIWTSARGGVTARIGLGVLFVVVTGCGKAATPTSVFLTIEAATAIDPAPDEVRVSVFGAQGAILQNDRLPATGALVIGSPTLLGTVTIYLPETTGRARLDVRALVGGTSKLEGTLEVDVPPGRQVGATVKLQAGILPDGDGDGVPDAIDNCPKTANPTQADADGKGVGDSCQGASDAGADVGVEPDGAAPVGMVAVTEIAFRAAVNLTTEGTLDWVHWGATSVTSFDHKAMAGGMISDLSQRAAFRYGTSLTTFAWSDGAPTASDNTNSGVYNLGSSGFSFSVPADPSMRTLRVYVGGEGVDNRLTARLSDRSAPDAVFSTTGHARGGAYVAPLEITFRSASAGQTLSLTWAPTGGTGTAAINGASLF